MKTKNLTLKLFRDKKREFRWTLISPNGKKLADSGESYKRRTAMVRALSLILLGYLEGSNNDVPMDENELRDCRPDITLDDETDGKKAR